MCKRQYAETKRCHLCSWGIVRTYSPPKEHQPNYWASNGSARFCNHLYDSIWHGFRYRLSLNPVKFCTMCNRTFWMITHTHLFEHKFWRDLFLHHSFCCARAQDACKLAAIHFGSDWIKTIRNEFCNVLYQHRTQIAWKGISHFRGLSNWFKIYKLQFLWI